MLRWRVQVRKLFLLRRNANLGLQKPNCVLCALNFRRNFFSHSIQYNVVRLALTSGAVNSYSTYNGDLSSNPVNYCVHLSVAFAFCEHKNYLWKLAFLALIIAAQCDFNSLKAQFCFPYCALGLHVAFCLCGATFFRLRDHPWLCPQMGIVT